MMKKISLLSLLGLFTTMLGCVTTYSDVDLDPIATEKVHQLLDDAKSQTVLVDVRPPAKFAAGHIPGALNIHLPDLVAGDMRLAEAKTIVVYSGSGTDYLCDAATKKMLALGYRGIRDYRGGLEDWSKTGGAVSKGGK